MKKTFATTIVAATMILTMGLVGCGGQKQAPTEPAAQEQAATETTTEAATQEQTPTTDAATTAEPAPQEQAAPAPEAVPQTEAPAAAGQISEEDAKAIAFQDAGVTEADVTLLNVHLDTDDGRSIYEVDFNVGATEYDYDIDVTSGAIIERSADLDD